MKKFATISLMALVALLPAVSAQAASPVRPDTAVWGSTSLLAPGARVATPRAKKVSQMTDNGKVLDYMLASGASIAFLWAIAKGHERGYQFFEGSGHCASPGGSCND